MKNNYFIILAFLQCGCVFGLQNKRLDTSKNIIHALRQREEKGRIAVKDVFNSIGNKHGIFTERQKEARRILKAHETELRALLKKRDPEALEPFLNRLFKEGDSTLILREVFSSIIEKAVSEFEVEGCDLVGNDMRYLEYLRNRYHVNVNYLDERLGILRNPIPVHMLSPLHYVVNEYVQPRLVEFLITKCGASTSFKDSNKETVEERFNVFLRLNSYVAVYPKIQAIKKILTDQGQ